jgi:hypothetical protein
MRFRTPLLAIALVVASTLGAVLADPPDAAAKDCGKTVINQYFNTGRIGYHPQACYASALKQIDPDARMYSGIMGAIRAARARDKAADEKAAAPQPIQPVDDGAGDGGAALPPMPTPMDTTPAEEPFVPDAATDDPVVAEVAAVDLSTGQAALPTPNVTERVPLPVLLLAGLAAVLTLVGLGGLAVRWIDRTS